jgi:hypothetical protein
MTLSTSNIRQIICTELKLDEEELSKSNKRPHADARKIYCHFSHLNNHTRLEIGKEIGLSRDGVAKNLKGIQALALYDKEFQERYAAVSNHIKRLRNNANRSWIYKGKIIRI